MKGLLHSKRFKQNLAKWLFMYVGVMMLLTTVITYSKYISSFGSSDEARTTKFNIKITPDDNIKCDGIECSAGNTRPTSLIEYGFTVDVKDIEVKSDLYLTLTLDEDFDFDKNGIVATYKDENNKEVEMVLDFKTDEENLKTLLFKIEFNENDKIITTTDSNNRIYLTDNIHFNLKIRAKDIYQKFDSEEKEIVTVGYSITQVK